MKCAVIARYRGEFPLALMCRVLTVARSTFYAWVHRAPSPRVGQDTRLQVALTAFHRRSGRTYGRPRLLRDLRDAGYRIGHERVRRLMRAAGLVGTPRRKFRVTTASDARRAAAANVLDRQFAVGPLNRAWGRRYYLLLDRRGLAVSGRAARCRLPARGGLGHQPPIGPGARADGAAPRAGSAAARG